MDYLPQNPAILVSSINMLLRDEEFDSLESLCYNFLSRSARTIISYLALFERLFLISLCSNDYYNTEPEKIKAILREAGYVYSDEQEQFRPIGFDKNR